MGEPTPPSGKGDGPVEGWVPPPRRGSDKTLVRVLKVVVVAYVVLLIGAGVGGCLYVWAGGDPDAPVVLPWETARTPASASAKWQEFLRHLAVSTDEVGSIKDGFGGIETFDPIAIDAQAVELQRWADSDTEWLDAHPPDPCYAEAFASWSGGVALYGEAGKLYREAIATNVSGYLGQATETMIKGDDEFRKTLDSMRISDATCVS